MADPQLCLLLSLCPSTSASACLPLFTVWQHPHRQNSAGYGRQLHRRLGQVGVCCARVYADSKLAAPGAGSVCLRVCLPQAVVGNSNNLKCTLACVGSRLRPEDNFNAAPCTSFSCRVHLKTIPEDCTCFNTP